jgi:hypothetical protein
MEITKQNCLYFYNTVITVYNSDKFHIFFIKYIPAQSLMFKTFVGLEWVLYYI